MGKNHTNGSQTSRSGRLLNRPFLITKVICPLLILQFFFVTAFAQKTINGTVKNLNGDALAGVTIKLKGTSIGDVTDNIGRYTINLPSDTGTLMFSYIGYVSKEISVAGKNRIDVVLEESSKNLQSLVVIGYGTQSKQTVTTSIAKLNTKVLKNVPLGNVETALQGTVPGVRVQTTSGQPGSAPRVIVRGGASIDNPNGATPLYIVDGVIREDLNGINSSDIESIEVLKDAASTAIYGARGSNGVVIVTTKKGKSGSMSINYKYTIGFSKLGKGYDMLNARDYIYYSRLGLAATGEKHPERLSALGGSSRGFSIGNDLTKNTAFTTQYLTPENKYKLSEGWQSMPDPLDSSKTIIFKGTDWQDVIFRTGITQDHYLSFSGGTDKATFYLGLGYTNIKGIAIYTNYKRYTLNLNGKLQLRKNISVHAGINFSRDKDNQVFSESDIFNRSMAAPPTQKYLFEDGTLSPGFEESLGNPAYYLSRETNKNSNNNISLSGGLDWELIPGSGLSFEPTASLLYKVGDVNDFQKSYYNGVDNFVDSRVAKGSYTKYNEVRLNAVLHYNKGFGFNHINATLGTSYFNRVNGSLSASGQGAATDLIPTLNASAEPVSVYSDESQQLIFGYFGRIIYDYNDKYLLTLSTRADGASNLGEANKWGWFPGISAGWNIQKEKFWDRPLEINRLKLRASYGVTGNLGNLADYQAQGRYNVGARYQGNAAVEYVTLANPSLRWEQSQTFDIGADAGAFNDRITLTLDYYRKLTKNLLTSLPLPYSTGFASILTNYGSLLNKGIEISLGATIVKSNDFSWDVSINATENVDKVVQLPDNGNKNNRIGGYFVYNPKMHDYTWVGGLQEGQPIGNLYGYKFLKVYSTDKEAENSPYDILVAGSNKSKFGGDVDWLDVDKNDTIDTRDQVYMGNIYPKWTGGFSSTLSYKKFSLYVRCDFATGFTIYNYVRASLDGEFVGATNMTTDILKSWLHQGDKTNVPRFYWADQVAQANYWRGDPRDGQGGSSVNYEKGNYLALREVTLSYNPSISALKSIGINSLRLFVTGSNLKYFTNYSGYNPEVGGVDNGRYPVPRTVLFGINLSF